MYLNGKTSPNDRIRKMLQSGPNVRFLHPSQERLPIDIKIVFLDVCPKTKSPNLHNEDFKIAQMKILNQQQRTSSE
jgi:hypothetical protein